jgi:hypothetical protein
VVPFFEEDTRAVYIFAAAYGARGAVSNLLDALVDHANAFPDKADQLPLVTLSVRSYPKNDGSTGFAEQFDIDKWVDRPAAVMHVQPPALAISVEPKASAEPAAAAKPPAGDATKRKIAVVGGSSYDDWSFRSENS